MTGPVHPPRRALFLDRDGVVNVDKNYVHRVEDFEFVPCIFELCRRAEALGLRLVVVTNQAGIARGYCTEADFERLTRWMVDAFGRRGITIHRVYHCPYHPTAGIGAYRRDSLDRKPNPGMLLRARDELGLDLSRSAFVGDQDTDMEAGRRAGVGTLIRLVHAEPPPAGAWAPDVHPVDSLAAAARLLEERASGEEAPISPRR